MANSPQLGSGGQLNIQVKSNGKAINETIKIASIYIDLCVNRIPQASLVLLDGDMPQMSFELSDSDDFKPGAEIELSAGYDNETQVLFSGVVVKHSVSIATEGRSQLKVICMDKCRAMAVGRNNANFIKQKDSDVIATLISHYSGLQSRVKSTKTQYQELVQYNCSDWDFLLTRAEANGYLVLVEQSKIDVAPAEAKSPELTVRWGEDLIDFDAELDASYQYNNVEAHSWDIKQQQVLTESANSETINKQGNMNSAELAKTFNNVEFQLQSAAPLEKTALKDWAQAQQVKSALARIRGTMSFAGSSKVKPGSAVEVLGVGKRFEGNVFVSRVEHSIQDGFWRSDVEFGMSSHWSAEYRDLATPPAAGLLPGVEGLQVGKVIKLDDDPLKQYRIQVSVPVLKAKTQGVWARLAGFYASQDCGHFFIPEVGDEVVLGYFNNNPCDPVILGSLYSSGRKPPYDIKSENDIKAIVSRSQIKIEFDEKDKILTLTTPGKNRAVFDDKDKSITFTDCNDNKIEMSKSGITLDSPKDIKLTAKGSINLKANSKISLDATGDASVAGLNVKLNAKSSFAAAGNSGAKISSPAITTVQGSMVKIN